MFGKRSTSTSAYIEADGPDATALELRLDGQGDLVPRGELVDEALAVAAQERRALAAHGLGDQEAVAVAVARKCRGVELDELQVGQVGVHCVGERMAAAGGARRVGALPQRRHPPVARIVPRAAIGSKPPARRSARRPTQRPSCCHSADALAGSSTSIRSARPRAPTGRA